MRYRLARHLRRLFRSAKDLKADLASGSIGGIAAIPDGLASAVMAGVNPIHGIYASIVGRIAGGAYHRIGDDVCHHHERHINYPRPYHGRY